MSCSGISPTLKIASLVSIKDENTTKSNQMWAEDNIYTINLYWPSSLFMPFHFFFLQNTTKLTDPFSLKRTTLLYVLRPDWSVSVDIP